MTNLLRVRLKWSGFPGAPGLSVFHFRTIGTGASWDPTGDDANNAGTKVYNFAQAIKGMVPGNTKLTVDSTVDVIEDTTGHLVNTLGISNTLSVNSTASATLAYAGPAGATINWKTNGVRLISGPGKTPRRVKGKTFLVPLHGQSFQNDGSLDQGYIDTLNTAANALRDVTTPPVLMVYGRPSSKGATDGVAYQVITHSVPDKVAVMRSRRD